MRYAYFTQPQSLKALNRLSLRLCLPLCRGLLPYLVALAILMNMNIIWSTWSTVWIKETLDWCCVFCCVWLVCHCVLVSDSILQGESAYFPRAQLAFKRLCAILLLIAASLALLVVLVLFYLYIAPKLANPENQKAAFILVLGISIPFVLFFSRFIYIVPLILLQRLPLLDICSHSLDLTVSVNGLKGALVYFGLGSYFIVSVSLHHALNSHHLQAYSTLLDCAVLMFFVPYTCGLLLLSFEDLELRNRSSEDSALLT